MSYKIPLNKGKTALEKAVIRLLNASAESGYTAYGIAQDILEHGCSSGALGGMIYYKDTLKFFKKHQQEIGDLLSEMVSSTGVGVEELFKDWDREDPLALETSNQNLLAWFAVEEVCSRLVG